MDRDDIPDGGSGHFAQTVKAMKVHWYVVLLFKDAFYRRYTIQNASTHKFEHNILFITFAEY